MSNCFFINGMDNLMAVGSTKTMSSIEIAKLTGKTHKNILRDVRAMTKSLTGSNLSWFCESASYTDKKGESREMYLLDKDTTLTLLSGYDVVARHKIIQRWTQLETERAEEETNPELALQRGRDRAVLAWKKKGKDDKWIEARINGVATRNNFTKTLAAHGVNSKEGFRNCTNAVYSGLFGGTSEVVRMKKGIDKSAKIRDNLSQVELAAVQLTESLAAENITQHNLRGGGNCELACSSASRNVGQAIVQSRRTFK